MNVIKTRANLFSSSFCYLIYHRIKVTTYNKMKLFILGLTFAFPLWYNQHVPVQNMEKYPSLVEGTGLENREVGNGAGVRIPLSPPFCLYRGMEQSGSSSGS